MSMEKKIEKIESYGEKKNFKKIQGCLKDKEPQIRMSAVDALKNIDTDESYNQRVVMLRDSDISVKKAAIKSLGMLSRKTAIDHITYIMNLEKDEELQEVCRKSISSLHGLQH